MEATLKPFYRDLRAQTSQMPGLRGMKPGLEGKKREVERGLRGFERGSGVW